MGSREIFRLGSIGISRGHERHLLHMILKMSILHIFTVRSDMGLISSKVLRFSFVKIVYLRVGTVEVFRSRMIKKRFGW
jgi:hypothetical protein